MLDNFSRYNAVVLDALPETLQIIYLGTVQYVDPPSGTPFGPPSGPPAGPPFGTLYGPP